MTTKEIIELLKEKETDFLKTETFSQLPGIYAFFYIGNDFPLLGDSVSKHQIIYIGKTESSQEKRDSKTHFTTGKTGNSTVRKSIGSILCSQENLTPIPRNDSDYEAGRFSHFKFDEPSEKIITNWMKNNFALSFYEYPESKKLIDKLETEIIKQLKPILNIDHKNPENLYKDQIKKLRKNCATIAINNSDFKNPNPEKKETTKTKVKIKTLGSSTSGIIYINNIKKSDFKSRNIRIKVDNKHLFPAEKSGKPISYSLDFKVGNIDFIAKYTIGSKDGKSRSGILKLGDNIYQENLKIQIGATLKISKSMDNKYIIEKNVG
jgi:hypothetical protein